MPSRGVFIRSRISTIYLVCGVYIKYPTCLPVNPQWANPRTPFLVRKIMGMKSLWIKLIGIDIKVTGLAGNDTAVKMKHETKSDVLHMFKVLFLVLFLPIFGSG